MTVKIFAPTTAQAVAQAAVVMLTGLLLAPAAIAQSLTPPPTPPSELMMASADFVDGQGRPAGSAALIETGAGLLIQVEMQNLPPGLHGFHLHETGRCDPPDFKSAGGHYNPTGQKHGFLGAGGSHAGDLPNLSVDADGKARVDMLVKSATLGGGPSSLFPANGTALVVHAGPDDYKTDPAGASGDRIACGVIRRR